MNEIRKINHLIASKILGYSQKRDDCNTFWVDSEGNEPDHGHDYFYEISDAWKIVEKLIWFKLGITTVGDLATEVFFCEFFDGKTFHIATGGSAPEAICLAALKVKGIDWHGT